MQSGNDKSPEKQQAIHGGCNVQGVMYRYRSLTVIIQFAIISFSFSFLFFLQRGKMNDYTHGDDRTVKRNTVVLIPVPF